MAVNLLQPGDPYAASSNPLRPPAANPYAPASDPVAATGSALWQWLQNQWPSVEEQRAMLQPLPGWQGTAVDAARQYANALMMGTTAPEVGAVRDLASFAAQARQINGGTMNEAAVRGQKPADGTLLWFLDGDKATYQNAHGSDARLHRGDELTDFPSVPVQNSDGSMSRVWFKEGHGDQAAQVARVLQMPYGAERDRELGAALGYAPADIERYVQGSAPR